MDLHHHDEPSMTPAEAAAGPGYEVRDADTRGLFTFSIGLVVFLVLVHLAVFAMYELFVARRPPPAAANAPVNLYEQLRSTRQSEASTLAGYGWVDRKAGVVRIPIDRAMDLVAQRGVPKGKGPRTPAELNSHHGMTDSAEGQSKDQGQDQGRDKDTKK